MVILYVEKQTLTFRVSRFLMLGVLVLVCFSVPAQSKKMKTADALYEAKEYARAIEAYKAILKDDASAAGVKSKIADCYRLTNSFSAAQRYYSEVVNSTERQPMDMYNYAECLKINGNIPEAKKWYSEYLEATPGDTNAIEKLASCTIYLDSANTAKCSGTFTAPDFGKINVPVTFNASKIQIKEGKITGYYWDFDDNVVNTGSVVKHPFTENRTHTVKLYITTRKNNRASIHCKSKVIDIKPGYKPAKDNLLEIQKQDAELRDKNSKTKID